MKLNLNCIRDTLITLENWLVLNDDLEFVLIDLDEICKSSDMLKCSKPEIAYTLVLLNEAGFIKAIVSSTFEGIDELNVVRLTYKGHQFLDTIRPQSMWDKIYSISEKTGLKSISSIMEISDILLPDAVKSILHS